MNSQDEFSRKLRERYNAAHWKHDGVRAPFALDPTAIDHWIFVERRAVPNAAGHYSDLFQSASDPAVLVLATIAQFATTDDAHAHLLHRLAQTMAPQLPPAHAVGVEVGDVGFGGLGPLQTSVTFVRGGVVVTVDSVGVDVSVKDFAEQLDATLCAHIRRAAAR